MKKLSKLVLILAAARCGWAQNTACLNSLCNFSFTLTASGPGSGLPGYQASFATNSSLIATVGSVSTEIPLSWFGIEGNGDFTTINIETGAPYVNISLLQFTGAGQSLNNLGRSGTVNIYAATDDFHGATGFMTYQFMCSSDTTQAGICYNGNGPPVSDQFTFSFTASGKITIPQSIAVQILPTLFPAPPAKPGFIMRIVNNCLEQIGPQQDPTNIPSQTSGPSPTNGPSPNVRPKTTAAQESGTMGFTIPWQYAASTYSATAECANLTAANCWITMAPPTGNISPLTDASVTADVNIGNLGPGVYPANLSVSVTATGQSTPSQTLSSPAQLVITNGAPALTLSDSAIQLQSGASSSLLLYSITLASPGSLSYQATASTLTGGNWLSIVSSAGTVAAGKPANVGISANPAGLAPGVYFGRVDITAPGAATAVQSIPVQLNVGSASAAPNFSPTGFVFVAPQGKNPSSQQVLVSTTSPEAITLMTNGEADNLGTWLKVSASNTTFQSGQSVSETVSINTTGLAPGVYTGNVYESASTSSATTQALLPVVLVITPSVGTCTPTQLMPVITNLYGSFEFPAGTAVPITARVVDDCGNPLTTGWVQLSPSSGDPPIPLLSVGDGQWIGTWLSHEVAGGQVFLVLGAQSQAGLQGTTNLTGTLDPNTTATVVTPGGIVNAANPVSGAPLAPGQFISIYGSNLGPTTPISSSGSSYQTTLAGTQVLLGGVPMPLQFVSSGVINAVVPFETPANAIQNLIVSANGTYALPEQVVVANTAPAIFTQNESGQGAGVIVVYKSNGTVYETSPTQPASAGDLLLIYASGLGAVSPAVADGQPGPTAPPFATTVNPVSATIGGVPATVSFAGIAPGYIGVYQVNVTVPAGITPGTTVPVVLTVGGFPSAPATVTIQ